MAAKSTDPSKTVEIPKNSKTVEGFVPGDWEVLEKTKLSDLNNDGKEDIVITIAKKGSYDPDYDMPFKLLVLLGTANGFELDYNIDSDLGDVPQSWSSDFGRRRDRLSIGISEENRKVNSLSVSIKTYAGHNVGFSDYGYTFEYKAGKLVIVNYQKSSTYFEYLSVPEAKYNAEEYNFSEKSLAIHDSNNTYVEACRTSATAAEKLKCPKPIETAEAISIPSSFDPEITNFKNFPITKWDDKFGIEVISK